MDPDEKLPLVIDNGSGLMKVGIAGDDEPRTQQRSVRLCDLLANACACL